MVDSIFDKPIESLGLRAITKNSLRRSNILTIGQLVCLSWHDLSELPCIGENSLMEISKTLEDKNLTLSMSLPGHKTFQERLKDECKCLLEKHSNLKVFMDSKEFYELDRPHKDLIYKQFILMTECIQVFGQRMELLGVSDFK